MIIPTTQKLSGTPDSSTGFNEKVLITRKNMKRAYTVPMRIHHQNKDLLKFLSLGPFSYSSGLEINIGFGNS
jgi:hypothetical protein